MGSMLKLWEVMEVMGLIPFDSINFTYTNQYWPMGGYHVETSHCLSLPHVNKPLAHLDFTICPVNCQLICHVNCTIVLSYATSPTNVFLYHVEIILWLDLWIFLVWPEIWSLITFSYELWLTCHLCHWKYDNELYALTFFSQLFELLWTTSDLWECSKSYWTFVIIP